MRGIGQEEQQRRVAQQSYLLHHRSAQELSYLHLKSNQYLSVASAMLNCPLLHRSTESNRLNAETDESREFRLEQMRANTTARMKAEAPDKRETFRI